MLRSFVQYIRREHTHGPSVSTETTQEMHQLKIEAKVYQKSTMFHIGIFQEVKVRWQLYYFFY